MQNRRLTDHPHLTFGSFHAVLEQTIERKSHRDENPNGRGTCRHELHGRYRNCEYPLLE